LCEELSLDGLYALSVLCVALSIKLLKSDPSSFILPWSGEVGSTGGLAGNMASVLAGILNIHSSYNQGPAPIS
tara:strand:- start:461 stop:679 length:219 start_codon:yes stop_codon:yes gene_type:complete